MRYGIFSDIHSNLEALDCVLESYKREHIDRFLCIGDVVGYATNSKECIEKISSLCMATVAGNHDWASVNLLSLEYFNPDAKEAIIWTRRNIDESNRYFLESLKLVYKNQDLTLVHGTLNNPQEFNYMTDGYVAWETFELLETDICFVGHTHRTGMFIKEGQRLYYREDTTLDIKEKNKYIINVGSVGQPRDGNPNASYCIYDTDKRQVEIKRVAYDFHMTRNKIFDMGLPHFLGDRLAIGR